jgi:hypothetical protein
MAFTSREVQRQRVAWWDMWELEAVEDHHGCRARMVDIGFDRV